MRVLLFLENSGWVLMDDEKWAENRYGQFTEGKRTGDTFFIFVDEKWNYPSKSNLELLDPAIIWITKSITPRNGTATSLETVQSGN